MKLTSLGANPKLCFKANVGYLVHGSFPWSPCAVAPMSAGEDVIGTGLDNKAVRKRQPQTGSICSLSQSVTGVQVIQVS